MRKPRCGKPSGITLLAVIGSALGVAYPALRAASYDPVVALAYE